MATLNAILAYAAIVSLPLILGCLIILIRMARAARLKDQAIREVADQAQSIIDKPRASAIFLAAAITTAIGANVVAVHVSQEKAVQKRHLAIAAQIEKARSIQATGKFDAAKEAWLLADRMGGDPGECLVRAAECCLYRNEYDEALELCQAANSRSPNCGMAFHVRGLVYQMLGDKDKAKEQYQIGRAYGCRASNLILGGKGA